MKKKFSFSQTQKKWWYTKKICSQSWFISRWCFKFFRAEKYFVSSTVVNSLFWNVPFIFYELKPAHTFKCFLVQPFLPGRNILGINALLKSLKSFWPDVFTFAYLWFIMKNNGCKKHFYPEGNICLSSIQTQE